MLGIYEKRFFASGEKVWLGRYRNLTNLLHWHTESEIIRVHKGCVQIRVGDHCYDALAGDCFFCGAETLHYIISQPDAEVEVCILHESIARSITARYHLVNPKLAVSHALEQDLIQLKALLQQKGPFYREALETLVTGTVIRIFQTSDYTQRTKTSALPRQLLDTIHQQFAYITFSEAATLSGYSPAHFSKLFKQLAGMPFSQYLNILKVEKSITMLRSAAPLPITQISLQCGFSTARNFNLVFRRLTGYSPRTLPADYVLDTGLFVLPGHSFDPTGKESVLL